MRLYLILILTLTNILVTNSQPGTYKYPVFFDMFTNCLPVVNPSSLCLTDNYEFNAGNQRVLGDFSRVSTNIVLFNIRLNAFKRSKYPYSATGIYLYNDREGKYLNRGRFYAQYAWHAKLNQKIFFSGGLKLGAVNYLVKGTPLSGDGSAYNADGGAGISFYSKKAYLGICFEQVFNATLQPIDEVTTLSPFFTLNLQRYFIVSRNIKFTPFILSRIPVNSDDVIFSIIGKAEYNDKFSFAAGYRKMYGLIFQAGFNNIEIRNGFFNIGLSYIMPTAKSMLNINTVEILISYHFKK